MEPEKPEEQLARVADVLGEIRDSWVLMSLALKDHLADVSMAQKDEVSEEVERYLATIRQSKH